MIMTFMPEINYQNLRVIEVPRFIIKNVSTYLPCSETIVNATKNKSTDFGDSMLILLFVYLFLLFMTAYVSLLHRYNQRSTVQVVVDLNKPNEYVKSIVDHIIGRSDLKHLVYNHQFYLSYDQKEFRLTPTILGRIFVSNDKVFVIEFFSNVKNANQIRQVLDHIYDTYVNRPQPQSVYTPFGSNNRSRFQFEQNIFETDMTLDDLLDEDHQSEIKQIRFFLERPEWYHKNSFPHTMGVLIHGPAGCGKTAYIKGIANESNRHIIMVPLDASTTEKQLHNLLLEEEIVLKHRTVQRIPFNDRLYVFQNIDRLSKKKIEVVKELLNGILEMPDRFVIFTAENMNKIHPGLFQNHRIDVSIDLGTCTVSKIAQMIKDYYDLDEELHLENKLKDITLTPAEVNEILLRHPEDHIAVIEELSFCNKPVSIESQTEVHEKASMECQTETFQSLEKLVLSGTNEPISLISSQCEPISLIPTQCEKSVLNQNVSTELQKEIDLHASEEFKKESLLLDFSSDSSLPSDNESFDGEDLLTTSQFLKRVVDAEIKEAINISDLSSKINPPKTQSYINAVKKSTPSYISKLTDKNVSVEKVEKDGNSLESSVIVDDFFQVKHT